MGELLKSRAVVRSLVTFPAAQWEGCRPAILTFLEDMGAIDLDQAQIGVFVLLAVAHGGLAGSGVRGMDNDEVWPGVGGQLLRIRTRIDLVECARSRAGSLPTVALLQ